VSHLRLIHWVLDDDQRTRRLGYLMRPVLAVVMAPLLLAALLVGPYAALPSAILFVSVAAASLRVRRRGGRRRKRLKSP